MKGRTATGVLDFLGHNAIALIALFVALGGTAYAATALPAGSVGTTQLKKNAVTGAKVKNDSITGADVLESSLGKVPSAASADSSASATHATSADSATNAASATHAATADSASSATNATHAATADQFGGIGPSVFGTAVTYAGVSFKPRDSATGYSSAPGGGMVRTSGSSYFTTPVLLPQGAKVKRLTFVFNNVAAGDSGTLFFSRYALDGNVTDLVGASSTSTSGRGSISTDLPTAETIDNTLYAYALVWLPPSSANQLAGGRLEYTLP